MKILVTGATGYWGTLFVRGLLKNNEDVRVLCRSTRMDSMEGITIYREEIMDEASVLREGR